MFLIFYSISKKKKREAKKSQKEKICHSFGITLQGFGFLIKWLSSYQKGTQGTEASSSHELPCSVWSWTRAPLCPPRLALDTDQNHGAELCCSGQGGQRHQGCCKHLGGCAASSSSSHGGFNTLPLPGIWWRSFMLSASPAKWALGFPHLLPPLPRDQQVTFPPLLW